MGVALLSAYANTKRQSQKASYRVSCMLTVTARVSSCLAKTVFIHFFAVLKFLERGKCLSVKHNRCMIFFKREGFPWSQIPMKSNFNYVRTLGTHLAVRKMHHPGCQRFFLRGFSGLSHVCPCCDPCARARFGRRSEAKYFPPTNAKKNHWYPG